MNAEDVQQQTPSNKKRLEDKNEAARTARSLASHCHGSEVIPSIPDTVVAAGSVANFTSRKRVSKKELPPCVR
jgi:hypothetical protein